MIKADLRCTDCLNKIKGLESVPSNSADLFIDDLPYGITTAKWDSIIPLKPLFKQYKRIIKDHGVILLFGVGLFASKLNVIGNEYVPYRYSWIWIKNRSTNQVNCHRMPMSNYEEISVFYKHLPTYNPQMRIGKVHNIHHSRKSLSGNIFSSGDYHSLGTTYTNKYFPNNVVRFKEVNRKYRYHPTQKPVKLLEYFTKTYSNKNDLVIDNTMGSGSTGVACVYIHRNFIGMEINSRYFNIACKRIDKAQSKVKKAMQHKYQQQKQQVIIKYQHKLQKLQSKYHITAPV